MQFLWLDMQGVLEVGTLLIFCVCTHLISYDNTDLTFRIILLKCQQKWTEMIVLISPIILKVKRGVFLQNYSLGLQNQQFGGNNSQVG